MEGTENSIAAVTNTTTGAIDKKEKAPSLIKKHFKKVDDPAEERAKAMKLFGLKTEDK